MQRVTRSTAVAARPAPPAPGTPGFFTGGAPGGQPATVPGYEWFNGIQETLLYVLTQAGITGLDHADDTLLYQAIQRLIGGGDYKPSCRVASTANVNTAAPGASIDGLALTAGDRVLLKNQTTAAQNGIWVWNGAAVAMTRATDADVGTELNSGAIIPIEQGTANADTNWQLTTDGAIVIGTSSLAFQAFGGQNFASNAEAQALAILTKAISPGTLNAAFQGSNQSLSANGYQKLPGGLILQWGGPVVPSGVVFPVAFPTAALNIILQLDLNTATSQGPAQSNVGTLTATGFSASTPTNPIRYFAIGY